MIDWGLAAQVAELVAGRPEPAPGTGGTPGRLRAAAAESERLVTAYTRLEPRGALPDPEPVSRPEWIRTNLASMRELLDPVSERVGAGLGPLAVPLRTAAGLLMTAEVGVVVGFVSQRVLGQYDVMLLDPDAPPRLLFVEPNLAEATRTLNAERDDLERWIALHEVTHAVQFGSVPWLRAHVGALVRELTDSLTVNIDPARLLRLPDRADVRTLVDAVRSGDLVSVMISPEQRRVLDRIQAVMAVIEGHAEHVMDAVGAEILPGLPRMREAMERRRAMRSTLARLVARLIGLEMKMRQYAMGKRFCDAVVEREGVEALNRVWTGPEAIPTLAELEDPEAWLRRTGPAAEAA